MIDFIELIIFGFLFWLILLGIICLYNNGGRYNIGRNESIRPLPIENNNQKEVEQFIERLGGNEHVKTSKSKKQGRGKRTASNRKQGTKKSESVTSKAAKKEVQRKTSRLSN